MRVYLLRGDRGMRLTSREKEILEVLKREPLISQNELAHRLGITRSSVAVHISNLIKKGAILGKGYVVNEQVSIVILGESYIKIDIKGQGKDAVINLIYGGFALEVAEIFANFSINAKIITVLGNDALASEMLSALQQEVDVSNVYRHPVKRSCRKVFVDNEVVFEEGFTLEDYEKAVDVREWVVLNCEWLVIEPRFQKEIHNKLLNRQKDKILPYFCSCRFLNFPEEIPEFLSKYFLVVLGVDSLESLDLYVSKVMEMPANDRPNFVITDGKSKLVYCDNLETRDFLLLPNQSFDSRDSLHFLLAGIVYGLSCGYLMRQAIRIGLGVVSVNEVTRDKEPYVISG